MNSSTFIDSFGYIADAPGGVDKLRRLILDLAMRGRLTSQDPADEPASAILQRAAQRKSQMIQSKLIRRPKAYPMLTADDEPYQLPEGWQWCRTVDLLHTVNGRAFKPAEWSKNGRPIIRIQNLNNAAAPFNYYNGDVDDGHRIEPGDLLISWSGTPGTSFGAFLWNGPPGVLNQHIFKCFLYEDYRDFVCLAVNSRLDVLIDSAHGGVGLQHFTKDKLERMALAVPPVAEQRRIVRRVQELMKLCSELEAQQTARASARTALTSASIHRISRADSAQELGDALANFTDNIDLHLAPGAGDLTVLKYLRQGIIDLAVRGRLTRQDSRDEPAAKLLKRISAERDRMVKAKEIRAPKAQGRVVADEQPYAPPAGWEWCRLGQLILTNEAGWSPVCPPFQRSDESEWGVLKLSAVSWGHFQAHEHKVLAAGLAPRPAIEVRDGDFLMSRANTVALVGRSVVVSEPPPRLMLSDLIVRLSFSDRATAEYVNLLNGSSYVREHYAAVSKGTNDTMRKLSRGQILLTSVPLPPLGEQRRIVRVANVLLAYCDELAQQFLNAQSHRGDLSVSVAAHVVRSLNVRGVESAINQ